MGKMLIRLLKLGHEVCIESSRLVIRSANKKPVPDSFLEEHSGMFQEILDRIRPEVYEYYEYSTGAYDGRFPGITLQFRPVFEGEYAYVIFNVDLTRERNTKAGRRGERLPPGQFRIKGERSGFYQFWKYSGAPFPRRLTSLHDYMGRLKGILFTAERSRKDPKRLDAKTLRPLSISAEEVRDAFLPDILQTNPGHAPDKNRTVSPDKISAQSPVRRGLQPKLTKGELKHGKAVNREVGIGIQSTSPTSDPRDQSEEEWMERYCSPAEYHPDSSNW